MEYTRAIFRQLDADVTGWADVSLKTTPAAGIYDFWGGALRISGDCRLGMGKAVLRLEDGRTARVLVDSIRPDDDGTSLVTFLGYTPLLAVGFPTDPGQPSLRQSARSQNPGADEDDPRGDCRDSVRELHGARLPIDQRHAYQHTRH